MSKNTVTSDTTIWNLPPSALTTTASRLLIDDQWKELAALIKRKRDGKLKFPTAGDIRILEANAQVRREKPSMHLLEFMGTQRYTVSDLIDLLVKAQLFWVADYLHEDVLKLGPAPRPKSEDDELEGENLAPDDSGPCCVYDREERLREDEMEIGGDTRKFSGPPLAPSTVELSKGTAGHRAPPAVPPHHPLHNQNGNAGHHDLHKPPLQGINKGPPTERENDVCGKSRSYSSSSTQEEVGRFESFKPQEQKLYEHDEIKVDSNWDCCSKLTDEASAHDKLNSGATSSEGSCMKSDFEPVCITHSPSKPFCPTKKHVAEAVPHLVASERPHVSHIKRDTGPVEQEEDVNDQQWAFTPGKPSRWQYIILEEMSAGFKEEQLEYGGRLVGKGGFGQVFLGLPPGGPHLAIKRFHDTFSESSRKQFVNEIQVMSKLDHKNLLPLLGFSNDGPYLCILYPYMPNGSLEDRLRRKNGTPILTVSQRMQIAQGAAEAICCLHHDNLIHRDIKSANILLDEDFVPRLGDFGLARLDPTPQDTSKTSFPTTTAIGTPAYMAPEATSKKISVKLDTYSYGVIILELLTGLPALDNDRDDPLLVDHVRENVDDIMEEVDQTAGVWPPDVSTNMYELAIKCVEHRHRRPLMTELIEDIRRWKI